MSRSRIVALAVVLLALPCAGPPAGASSPARAGAPTIRCAAPAPAQTEGIIQLLRARRASCRMARRIATAWDALCRSETDSRCTLRTQRTWRCDRVVESGSVRCRSGRRMASFFWEAGSPTGR